VTSGFRRDVNNICARLEFDAVYIGSSVPTIRENLERLNLEDEAERLPRKVGTELPFYACHVPKERSSYWPIT